MLTCSAEGSGPALPLETDTVSACKGASISADLECSAPNQLDVQTKLRTGVFHMLKQPVHCCFRITVARGEERFLASNSWESHGFQLRHCSGIELGHLRFWRTRSQYRRPGPGVRGRTFLRLREFYFAVLFASAEILV